MAVLRELVSDDLDALLVIQQAGAVRGLGHLFPQDVTPFPVETIRQRWLDELADPETHCFAVTDGHQLAGFAATRHNEFLHFGTAVASWGSGLAAEAHDEVLDHLRSLGHRRAWLWVFEENARGVRFYERLGWRPTSTTSRTTFPPHPTLRRFELDL